MISLKLPKEESTEGAMAGEGNPYGWGTTVSLEEEQVSALNIASLPVGTRVRVTGFAIISGTRIDVEESEGPNMTLQLTDLEVAAASSVNAESMYTKG